MSKLLAGWPPLAAATPRIGEKSCDAKARINSKVAAYYLA
jgi:hypothetical protein